jgi:DNA-binding GntR family transcriptional regulator
MLVVKKLRRTSLSVDAYAFVRDLFTNGTRYKPGEKISVEELSRELGVSRTPLWGAINRLEAEGIVEIVPRQGVYLIDYDPGRVLEIYQAREALEGMAARLAAEKITDRQIAALEENIKQQRERLAKNDVKRYYALALSFHEQIARVAQNHTLERLITSILAQIHAMGVQHNYMPMHLPQSCDDHDKLIQALRQRDPDRAEQEARIHMRDLFEEIRRTLQPQPPAHQSGKKISTPV